MKISYKNKMQIVEHPSGCISKHTKEDLQRVKKTMLQSIVQLNNEVLDLDSEIAEIESS